MVRALPAVLFPAHYRLGAQPRARARLAVSWDNVFRGLPLEEVRVMSASEVTARINQRNAVLLQSTDVALPKDLPVSGEDVDRNAFVASLAADVPQDLYTPAKVFSVGITGEYTFARWLWTLCGASSLHRYAQFYQAVNHAPFPREAFLAQRRRIKNRGYQQACRTRRPRASGAASTSIGDSADS